MVCKSRHCNPRAWRPLERQLSKITEPEHTSTTSVSEPTFEHALAGLEQIVHDLEEGQIGLAESLAKYEEGVKLLRQCYMQLEQAERKIELLTGMDAAGNPVMQSFDDQSTMALQAAGKPRSRHEGKAKKPREESESLVLPPVIMDEPGSLF